MTESSLKVLVLADSRAFHTERYVAELQRQGCQVLVASLECGTIDHHCLRRRGPFRVLHYPLAATEVTAVIRSYQPDVVNPHFASGYGFLAAMGCRHESVPLLLHVWGSDILIVPKKSFLHRRKTRVALESANCVIGDSDYLLMEAGKIGQIGARRTITWGIERQYLQHYGGDSGLSRPVKILVPRPHEAVYNNLFIVRALAGLVNDGRIELTFPDFGGQLAEFKTVTNELVGDRLKFYSKLPREDYLSLAAKHDVYLSATISDSSPASLLEAMGLGLIPVAGDIPGVREWLTPASGFLFDLSHERSLTQAIAELIESDRDHTLMRRNNRERIEQKAVFEENIAETIGIMRDLVVGKKL